jgi:hypothetical protein
MTSAIEMRKERKWKRVGKRRDLSRSLFFVAEMARSISDPMARRYWRKISLNPESS